MLDISFAELLVCMVVALIVLGPEKLPKLARTVGRWSGQAKAYLGNLSAELDRESKLSELKKQVQEARDLVAGQQREVQDAARKLMSGPPKP